MELEWDREKAASNLARHGVSFEEASEISSIRWPQRLQIPGIQTVNRGELTMGLSFSGRLLVAWHTDRRGHTRIIGARPPTPYERRKYESA